MKKGYLSFIIVLTACILAGFIHCPLFELYFDDKEIFKYCGFVLSKGGVPYRDFFDHKPPLIFFLNYAGLLIGSWGLWIIDFLLVIAASLLFLRLCKKQKLSLPWLLPVLFVIMIRNPYTSFSIGMTREYTAIFILLFFCAMMSASRYKYYTMGILCSLIFFMQQEQLLIVTPFFLYTLFKDDPEKILKHIGKTIAGSLIVALPVVLYFTLNHSLHYFWEDAFLFNLNWYTEKKPLWDNIKATGKILRKSWYDISFYTVILMSIGALIFLNNKRKYLLIAALVAMGLSLTPVFLSGKLLIGLSLSYYLLPLAALIPIITFILFAYTEGISGKKSNYILIFSAILYFGPAVRLLYYSTHLSTRHADWVKLSPEFQYISTQNLSDYELYVFYNSNMVYAYNQLRILSPSPWIYHYFWNWYGNWDADQKILSSITTDLQEHHTKYVLDYSDSATFRNSKSYIYWKSFLQEYYNPVNLNSTRVIVWKIKP